MRTNTHTCHPQSGVSRQVWELWEGESRVERCKLPLPGRSWSVPHCAGLLTSRVFETVTSLSNSVHISQELLQGEWLKAAQLPKASQVKRNKEQMGGGWSTLASTSFCRARQCRAKLCCAMLCCAVLCHAQTLWEEESLTDAVCLFQGELLSPCRCDGSVKCTHQPCLIKWISERGCWSCELCYYKYHVIAISTKNPLQVKVLETFQSLFILISIFVFGRKWILPVWVFLPSAQRSIC